MCGASRIFAVEELSILILMAQDLLFTVVPSKIELTFSFTSYWEWVNSLTNITSANLLFSTLLYSSSVYFLFFHESFQALLWIIRSWSAQYLIIVRFAVMFLLQVYSDCTVGWTGRLMSDHLQQNRILCEHRVFYKGEYYLLRGYQILLLF